MPDEIIPAVGLTGLSGYGKTYKAKQLLAACPRAIVYDMICDEGKNHIEHGYSRLGYQIIDGPLPVGSTILVDAMRTQTFHICYRPKDIENELNYFCECLKWARNLTVFFDECWYLTENKLPMDLREIIRLRIHLNITPMFACQRPQKFGRDLYNALTLIYAFRATGVNDIEYLEKTGPGFELKQLSSLGINQYAKLELCN